MRTLSAITVRCFSACRVDNQFETQYQILTLQFNATQCTGCLPSSSGQLCLVMDLCEGGSVKDLLLAAREPLLERHIAYVVRCVLLALEYLHNPARQVVHRDIKAANILLSAEGRVRLADFGDKLLLLCGTEIHI